MESRTGAERSSFKFEIEVTGGNKLKSSKDFSPGCYCSSAFSEWMKGSVKFAGQTTKISIPTTTGIDTSLEILVSVGQSTPTTSPVITGEFGW